MTEARKEAVTTDVEKEEDVNAPLRQKRRRLRRAEGVASDNVMRAIGKTLEKGELNQALVKSK